MPLEITKPRRELSGTAREQRMPKSGRNGVTIQDGTARSLRRGHGLEFKNAGREPKRIGIQTRGKRQALHEGLGGVSVNECQQLADFGRPGRFW